MNVNKLEESIRRMGRYSRQEGETWRVMRESIDLPFEPPIVNPDVIYPKATLLQRITDLSDALASDAIRNNTEVIQTPSSLGSLWKRIALPNPVGAPKTEVSDVENFDLAIKEYIWTQQGQTQKGIRRILPCSPMWRVDE